MTGNICIATAKKNLAINKFQYSLFGNSWHQLLDRETEGTL